MNNRMAEVPKLLYIIVNDEDAVGEGPGKANLSFRYTRSVLHSTLQLMGCKPRHAFKISKRVFDIMRTATPSKALYLDKNGSSLSSVPQKFSESEKDNSNNGCIEQGQADRESTKNDDQNSNKPFQLYKKRTTVVVKREKFLDVVCDALAAYKYVGPNQRADLVLACRVRERKESMTILLCGTSGCGKSTLSALLASRLGITTVVSTDSIRHMMRSFVDEKENPLLWASTYHAGEFLDPVAVAEAKAKKKAKKLAGIRVKGQSIAQGCGLSSNSGKPGNHQLQSVALTEKQSRLISSDDGKGNEGAITEAIGPKFMAVEGFKAQSEMVIDSLDRLITAWEERKESVVVEGVHLSLNFVMGLMKKHPSIIPFMIYIASEDKHMERFAVRAKYMTLDPAKNKYVKYIRNIRTIQDYLCKRADKHLVPKVNNTNVDRSVAAIHATIFSCLRRQDAGEHLYDHTTNTVDVLEEEYRNQCAANSLSSKGMFQLIQRKGSHRQLMALVNTDGSVAKAWPFESVDNNGKPMSCHGSDSGVGNPMYGPLQIGKAEPVNLQFGNFGISAWPNDIGGTSHASSIDGSRADGTETSSRYYSSCSSSPRHSDERPAKELTEDLAVPGSDEEPDEPPEVDTDEDLSDTGDKEIQEDELEGSVDEESTRSDEEYEDLAIHEGQDDGYWSDNPHGDNAPEHELEYPRSGIVSPDRGKQPKCSQDVESFPATCVSACVCFKPSAKKPSLESEQYSRSMPLTTDTEPSSLTSFLHRVHGRSQSVPPFEKYIPVFNGLIVSGASTGLCSQQ
eukprot:Gb_20683 [translate_table: standard]